MKSFVIVGLGRFGLEVAGCLGGHGCKVLAIDRRQEAAEQAAGESVQAIVGDARDEQLLMALNVSQYDCAIVTIGQDIGASVLAAMNLRELGVRCLVCRAADETHQRILMKVGADGIIPAEQEETFLGTIWETMKRI